MTSESICFWGKCFFKIPLNTLTLINNQGKWNTRSRVQHFEDSPTFMNKSLYLHNWEHKLKNKVANSNSYYNFQMYLPSDLSQLSCIIFYFISFLLLSSDYTDKEQGSPSRSLEFFISFLFNVRNVSHHSINIFKDR